MQMVTNFNLVFHLFVYFLEAWLTFTNWGYFLRVESSVKEAWHQEKRLDQQTVCIGVWWTQSTGMRKTLERRTLCIYIIDPEPEDYCDVMTESDFAPSAYRTTTRSWSRHRTTEKAFFVCLTFTFCIFWICPRIFFLLGSFVRWIVNCFSAIKGYLFWFHILRLDLGAELWILILFLKVRFSIFHWKD